MIFELSIALLPGVNDIAEVKGIRSGSIEVDGFCLDLNWRGQTIQKREQGRGYTISLTDISMKFEPDSNDYENADDLEAVICRATKFNFEVAINAEDADPEDALLIIRDELNNTFIITSEFLYLNFVPND